jgi:hypothetical protein
VEKTVEVPQKLWEEVLEELEAQSITRCTPDVLDLLYRIRKHFDGPDETD